MIGDKIKRDRELQNMSLRALAKKAGISKSTLSDIENNKTNPTMATIEKLADALEINIEYWFKTELTTEEILREQDEKYANKPKEDVDLYENGEFTTPQAAMQFILKQPAIMGFGGFDASKMTDEDIIAFANELLNLLKMLGPKYNK